MAEMHNIGIQKAANGYVIQQINSYASYVGTPQIFSTFEEAIKAVALNFKEEEFANTIEQSQALSKSLTAFVSCSVAPKLLALEGKINPGKENLVDGDDIPI